MPDTEKEQKRLRQRHAERLAESAPLLDKSLPLGKVPSADHYAIKAYYAEKHRTGPVGRFWPLHETKPY